MQKTSRQQGSVLAVVTICLGLALVTALGWIFWQNFIFKEAKQKDTEIIAIKKHDKASESTPSQTTPAPVSFSAADLSNLKTLASSQQCGLDAQEYTRVKVLSTGQSVDNAQIVGSDGTKQAIGQAGVTPYQGAVDEHNTWAFMSGGCGSQATGFLFRHDTDGTWKLIAKAGNTMFACSSVDNKGVPASFMAKCWDDARNQERAIVQ